MEVYLARTHYDAPNGLLLFAVGTVFIMVNVGVSWVMTSYVMSRKQSKSSTVPEIEIEGLVRKAISAKMEPLERKMAARDDQMAEAIEIAHLNQARITALEDDYNKAMKELDALRASIQAQTVFTPAPRSRPASPQPLSSPSEHSSRASSHSQHDSDVDSIYGTGDYTPSPTGPASPDRDLGVSSPQLDQATEDELAELAGWGLDDEPPEETGDDNGTDQDAEGEIDDEYEPSAPPGLSAAGQPFAQLPGLGRPMIRPLSACKTKGSRNRPE